jgi:hypothetical protein
MGIPGAQNARFLAIAESLVPSLRTTEEKPLGIVKIEKYEHALLGWRATADEEMKTKMIEQGLRPGDRVLYDFGGCS